MRSYILTASALTALANAQTFTLCNPMEKDCDNNPAIAETFESNFKDGERALKGWQQTAKGAEFTDEGVVFSVKKTGDAPTIQSDGYLHFGFVEVTMKAARGAGIVSSIVLESDDLDEVDWEFIGSDATHAQMNYFGKGNTTVYDRMIMADVPSIEEVHRYALNWTAESLTWLIDDAPVRTLNYGDANGGHNYPQTPCNVRIGIWAGGDSKDKGTQDWAGGKVDYSQAPFNQVVEKVKIINYSPGKEYEWTDKSGSWESIKVIGGKGIESGGSSDSPKPKPSASATGKPEEDGAAATSTPCSEEATKSTPPPEETPCDCEVETVTVTGPPPVTETPGVPTPPPEVPVTSDSPPPEVPVTSEAPPPPESTTPVESTSCTESTETPGIPTPPPEVPVTSDSPPPPESSTQPPVTESSEVPPPPPSSTPAESSSSEVPPPPSSSEVPPPPPESTSEVPPESTPCTTSTESVPTAPATSDSPPPPESTEASSTVPPSPPQATPPTEESSSSVPAESSPCTDSTITVTTTIETPPPVETPKDNCTSLSSVTVPPYPTGGIIVETSPAPSVPYPSNPTGAYPNPPNSTKHPSEEFLGAASTSTVSYLLAIAAGVMVFVL
ncbi:concanavalin A-like lectin/glucanase [Bimuria novae-zelandiae CBS 107.79]|uniref:chitinase n=1 Tax=Bimuria novae-zelandiae CBS 107.79 TaxID=1447943 RepID=A0A6A5W090_9PLEO|nr:concanavalin A-like lectin/glucanase [Bimuria novae-zelandiae CBS 107.79]